MKRHRRSWRCSSLACWRLASRWRIRTSGSSKLVRVVAKDGKYTHVEIEWRFDPFSSEDRDPADRRGPGRQVLGAGDQAARRRDDAGAAEVRLHDLAQYRRQGFPAGQAAGTSPRASTIRRASRRPTGIARPATRPACRCRPTSGPAMPAPPRKTGTAQPRLRHALRAAASPASLLDHDLRSRRLHPHRGRQTRLPAGCKFAKHPTYKSEFVPGVIRCSPTWCRASCPEQVLAEQAMPYLVAADLPTAPAGRALPRAARAARHPANAGRAQRHGGAAGEARPGFDALYLSGAAMTASMGLPDLGVITVDEVCFFIRQVARASGLPRAGRRRHRLRRGAERHAHGARLRGGGRRRGPYRGPAAAQEVRPSQRQEARRSARHGGQGRCRRQGAPRISFIVARTDAAASEGMDGAVARAKRYLEAGADAIFPEALDQRRDVPRLRQGDARREAAGQHDRVRPHAVLHRERVRGDGLPAW